ncbi:MAG: hypothetical protein HYY17_01610 [Planctomycetes bacterium]|nr:hypothetical protein [Planctomycetota bacterium]
MTKILAAVSLLGLGALGASAVARQDKPSYDKLAGKRATVTFQDQVDARGTFESVAFFEGTVTSVDATGILFSPSKVGGKQVRTNGESVLVENDFSSAVYVPWTAVKHVKFHDRP